MERCGFFDANLVGEEYDRVYLASQFAAYFASFIGNGVFAEKQSELKVTEMPTQQMGIAVKAGQAWINGYWYENTEDMFFDIDVADGVLNRIDSVVVRLGHAERNMWLAVKKGTPAVNPVAPTLTRNADYYELQLATVMIAASSIKVTQSAITDTRMVNAVCGWVTGVVEQIDTTDIFNQFEAFFAEFKQQNTDEFDQWAADKQEEYQDFVDNKESQYNIWTAAKQEEFNNWYSTNTTGWSKEFNDWFENVKDQLSQDAAGQLQNMVDELDARLGNIELMLVSEDVWFLSEISTGETLAVSTGELLLFDWAVPQL